MSKLRITTYNQPITDYASEGPAYTIENDRLVEANVEFRNGPKEEHKGPVRIDMLLTSSEDANGLIKYLQQLTGVLPIEERTKRTSPSSNINNKPLAADALETLIKEAFNNKKKQEDLIDYLRSLNFVFVTLEHLQEICKANDWPFNLKKKKPKNNINGEKPKTLHTEYQWMVRQLKLAKIPKNDKYDPQIFFGFKLLGDKLPKVQIYISGKYSDTRELHWGEEAEVNFKVKEKFYKFPEPMTYEERHKWRAEDRKFLFNADYEPTDFYERWKPYVTILKPQRPKRSRKK